MNILFFTISPPNPHIGGVERTTYNLSTFFRDHGAGVFYICMKATPEDQCFVIPKTDNSELIRNYIDSVITQQAINIIIDQYGIGGYMTHGFIKSDVKIVRCWHQDVKERHITHRLLDTFSVRRPKLSLLNLLFWINTPKRRFNQRKGFSRIVQQTDCFMLLSNSYKKYLVEKFHLPEHKMEAIHNGIIIPPNLHVQRKENLIVFCGRLAHIHKNVLLLLKLWNQLHKSFPDWHFIIVGEGIDRDLMEREIRKRGMDRINITGFVNPEEYYKRAKILLLPSFTEGFGMVLPEGMLYGCVPIVYDTCPAYYDIIRDGDNGFIVEDQNDYSYIATCKHLMEHESIRAEMSNKCVDTAKRFDIEVIGQKWMDFLQKM